MSETVSYTDVVPRLRIGDVLWASGDVAIDSRDVLWQLNRYEHERHRAGEHRAYTADEWAWVEFGSTPSWPVDEDPGTDGPRPPFRRVYRKPRVPGGDEHLAYDGSNFPPRRDLTARERDVVCRVITDILAHARHVERDADLPPGTFDATSLRMWPGELTLLHNVREALDPRES